MPARALCPTAGSRSLAAQATGDLGHQTQSHQTAATHRASTPLARRALARPTRCGVELFSGCGGLALGIARAGFDHRLLVEWNEHACGTLAINTPDSLADTSRRATRGHARESTHWPLRGGDVRAIEWRAIRTSGSLGVDLVDATAELDLLAGGPPCQPFSSAGSKRGHDDPRDMWPEAIRAVRELTPRAFLFENVPGLLSPRCAPYLRWIVASLRHPQCTRQSNEAHDAHLERLDRSRSALRYIVGVFLVNAADFGAAQQRRRVVVAGLRREPGAPEQALTAPVPTHSRDALLWEQWISGEYWQRHGLCAPKCGPEDPRDAAWVDALRASDKRPSALPWITTRDALAGLGEPDGDNQHDAQAGAKVYRNHTGSALDLPAKVLKAGDHGVPGGENMLIRDDGTPRYFSVREAARLQGFPDSWRFNGRRGECMRQLGNAVPVPLAHALGDWIHEALSERDRLALRAQKVARKGTA